MLFEQVVKRYERDGATFNAVDHIDLSVHAGEIFGLLGPNGAGKTTGIEMIAGLRVPTSGVVRVLGLDPVAHRDELRQVLAVQPQHAALFDQQTVTELLRLWASFYPKADRPEQVIARLGLTESANVRAAELSGGQRQRLLVATALISRPRLLVLDEPSTGLDPSARQELWGAVRSHRAGGGTVLLSTHLMEEAAGLCDRVAILHKGRVVACGTPGDLVREHAPERQLIFDVDPDADLTPLRAHAGVTHLVEDRVNGRLRVTLSTTDADALLGVVSGPLGGRRIQVKDAGLEGVFLRLTGSAFAPADEALQEA
ncbi:ABC transporter ATP-binding protein [Sphaerisporangium krabiense]|uniref:ABC-2 type transport system ATP-binding protein n=1 Tax=Sphaerisporangium krabiense TaxID=763782 RepID=A0A7W9DQU4_9ACTN|nr:ABC transporter ATP-binding protein [Sphaerisporangium krabiense]MBB5627922.1 ABC-2 type transport system ATP-binding protein [Sphaerisporangium krabiense]